MQFSRVVVGSRARVSLPRPGHHLRALEMLRSIQNEHDGGGFGEDERR